MGRGIGRAVAGAGRHRRDRHLPGFTSTGIAKAARHAGACSADLASIRAAAVDGLARPRLPAEKVALAVMRAALRDKPVVPVNTEAWLTFALSRLSPAALRGLARRLQAFSPAVARAAGQDARG